MSYDAFGNPESKHFRLPGENYLESMTPVFRYEKVYNEHASVRERTAKYDLLEVVELNFAADRLHKPVKQVNEPYRTLPDGRVITYAERFAEQYKAFLAGETQHAFGTPLEELQPYGITPAQLSICRALGIMSIEALDQLEGAGRKRLGAHGNELKPMARRWMEARGVSMSKDTSDELAALRAQVQALTAAQPEQVDEPVKDDAWGAFSDSELKDEIERATGARPRGNPSRATLVSMLDTAQAA